MKSIVVTGSHRTGTSMIAGVLEKLGVNMGKRFLQKNPGNPLGYFEDQGIYNLNERILDMAGGSWHNPPKREEIDFLQEHSKDLAERIATTVKNRKDDLWGFKDPRTSITIQLYLPFLDNPHFIITKRDKDEIVKSFKRRDGHNKLGNAELVDEYRKRIKDFLKEYPDLPLLEIDYSNAVKNPEQTVKRIAKFLKIKPKKEAIDFIKSRDEITRLAKEMMTSLDDKYEQEGAYHWKRYEEDPFYKQHVDYITKEFQNKDGLLLDVGCGDGLITAILAQHMDVKGIDINEKAIKLSRKKCNVANFEVSDVFDMSGGFDYLLASELLEHLPNPNELLKHIKGLFEKEALITTPNGEAKEVKDIHHFREYSKEEFRSLLEEHFKQIKIDKRGFNLYAWVK